MISYTCRIKNASALPFASYVTITRAVQNTLDKMDAAPLEAVGNWGTLQERVKPWMLACFGPVISADVRERCHRFFEEAGELCQAAGMSYDDALALITYTWSRPKGELPQEVGGVMITLAALCLASGVDMDDEGERELQRIWGMIEKIRAKQASKRKLFPDQPATPLPGAYAG